MKCSLSTHIDRVRVSPTNGNGSTQGQGKTLTRMGSLFERV